MKYHKAKLEEVVVVEGPGHGKRRYPDGKIRPYQWCLDCKQEWPNHFMVKKKVWEQAGIGKGIICLSCFAVHLPRPMIIDDFVDVPINELVFFGYCLAK